MKELYKKYYKFDEWDIKDDDSVFIDERTYIDLDGNPVTGILEGFWFYSGTKITDKKNQRYVENGKAI
jgi:hypothetical protein